MNYNFAKLAQIKCKNICQLIDYQVVKLKILLADAKSAKLANENFWQINSVWVSISYEVFLAHVCQNQAVTCAKPCANTDKYSLLRAFLTHFDYHLGRFSCANPRADCWHTIVNIKSNRKRIWFSYIFGVFCWVKKGIKRHQDIDDYLFVWFGIYSPSTKLNGIYPLSFYQVRIRLFTIFTLFRKIVPDAKSLCAFHPFLNFLSSEHGSPSWVIMGNALEVHPTTDGLEFGPPWNHPPQFVDVDPVLTRTDGPI